MWNRCKTWRFLQWRSSWVASKKGPFSGQSRAPCSTTMWNLHPSRPKQPCTYCQQALEFANDTLAQSFARNTLISCSSDHLRSARTSSLTKMQKWSEHYILHRQPSLHHRLACPLVGRSMVHGLDGIKYAWPKVALGARGVSERGPSTSI